LEAFLKTTVKKLEDNKILLTVEVPAVEMKQMLNEAARSLSTRINIPGFRKGSVPTSVIEAKVGAAAIVDEFFKGGGLGDLYGRAISETEYEPIAQPEVDVEEAPESGKPFKFKATVEVKPEVDLSGIKKIKVKKPAVKVTDEDLEKEIESLQDRFAEIKEAKAKKVENGLLVMLDFAGSVDGAPLEGGKAEDYLLEIGSNSFWPGFEEQLMGAAPGEEREVSVAVPENYFEKTMAGQTATFKVKVKELKKKEIPALDAKFAKKVGFESVEGLRKDVKENIQRVKDNQAREQFGGEVLKAATLAAKVDVPKTMVEQYTDRMLSSFQQQLMEVGATLEDYLATQDGLTMEKFREGATNDATLSAKSDLMLEALARQEKIIVADDELDIAIDRYIGSMGEDAKFFTEGPDALANRSRLRAAIKIDLIKAKAADWLVNSIDKPAPAGKPAKAAKKDAADKSAKDTKTDKEDKA
jgi:trigger factor